MVFRNSLHPAYAVLVATSLAACLGAVPGCNTYDDELLRKRDDTGGSKDDASGSDDAMPKDVARPLDDTARDDGGTIVLDAATTDVSTDGDATTTRPDAGPQDGPPSDDGAPRDNGGMSIDAGGAIRDAGDAADARFDATTGSQDADAALPVPDATDAAVRDGFGGADVVVSDAGGATSDVSSDADGGSTPPTFRVVRVGDGTTALSAESTAVFIEERRSNGSVVGAALALPTSGGGSGHPFTLSGVATSEGALSLSLDGRFLTVAGYATPPGRDSVASSNVDRVAGRVDASGAIDTSTLLGAAFSGSNVRSATSLNGAGFWVGGTGGASGGIWYVPLGGTGGAQIVTTPDNVRGVQLFGGQLYGSSGASPMTSVFTVGAGTPTTGVQSVAALAGMPRSGMSPYAFVLFDLSGAVAGLDTMYLTDDRAPESDGTGGGIQKWTFDGVAWSRIATFNAVSGGGSAAFRGLGGTVTTSGVILMASTADASTNRLVVFVDDGSADPTGSIVATAPANTIFRGVALSPHN